MTSKLTIAAFFVLATFKISFVVCIRRDDYTKIPIGNCYEFREYFPHITWVYAKEWCEADGGMLYYPNSEQELETVFRELNVYDRIKKLPSKALHIGYSDPNSDGLLKTVDGRHLTFVWNKWAPGQPTIRCYNRLYRPCSCVAMSVVSHEIFINNCLEGRSFICSKKPNTNRKVNAETGQLEPICRTYTYIQTQENYYKYYAGLDLRINWYNAKAKCESDGAELFHPDNLSELEQVLSGLRNTSLSTSSIIFLGFSNLEKLGEFKTLDGRFLHDKFQMWTHSYKPNPNDRSKRCGVLVLPERFLMNYYCLFTEDFICKRRRAAVVTEAEKKSNAACGVDYDLIPCFKSCYKYHKKWEDWNTARAICQSEGGHLFHPDNELELDLVLDELDIPGDMIFYAGFSDLEKHGVYKTVKGRPLEEVFAKWTGGRPHPEICSGDCHCGVISVRDRTIYLGYCPLSVPFVCKRAAVQQ